MFGHNDCEELFGQFMGMFGQEPYSWQRKMNSFVISKGYWPQQIDVPTGGGKTAVIPIHIFVNALAGWVSASEDPEIQEKYSNLKTLPRRLCLAVPRRALVDSQLELSYFIQDKLKEPGEEFETVAKWVRDGLKKRAGVLETDFADDDYLVVSSLRGGAKRKETNVSNQKRRLSPEVTSVVHVTPQLFGSSLLFRNYLGTRNSAPNDAGLFAYDTVVIVDEAHLTQQLVLTASQIKRLEPGVLNVSPLQVVSTTATQSGQTTGEMQEKISVDISDEAQLKKVLQAKKSLLRKEVGTIESNSTYESMADDLLELSSQAAERGDASNNPIGCIVNTVESAVQVSSILKKKLSDVGKDTESVVLVVGRMRPWDRMQIEQEYPGLFSPAGNSRAKFIIATQTLEVGIDLDLAGLVTELASASAIAQRVGRVNRRGLRTDSRVVVYKQTSKRTVIYSEDDLRDADDWLERFVDSEEGLSPYAISQSNIPIGKPRRTLFQRLEWADAEYLSHTSEKLAAEQARPKADIALWLEESFEQTVDSYFVVRKLPEGDNQSVSYMKLIPVEPEEMFPVSIANLQKVLNRLKKQGSEGSPVRILVKNPADDEYEVVHLSNESQESINPGAIIIVNENTRVFIENIVKDDPKAISGHSVIGEILTLPFLDESSICNEQESIWALAFSQWLKKHYNRSLPFAAFGISVSDKSNEEIELLYKWLYHELHDQDSLESSELFEAIKNAIDFLKPLGVKLTVELLPPDDPEGEGAEWFFIARCEHDSSIIPINEDIREIESMNLVYLDDHNKAVGERVAEIAKIIGLPEKVIESLYQAGIWHDAGKSDERFQAFLRSGNRDAKNQILAKGVYPSRSVANALRNKLGLVGWRHEQLSAAMAFAHYEFGSEALSNKVDRKLVCRLVGTSHGRGRDTFRDGAAGLLAGTEGTEINQSAIRLFDEGEWESLIEQTTNRFGIWGVAYLEALLRAADMAVSADGR